MKSAGVAATTAFLIAFICATSKAQNAGIPMGATVHVAEMAYDLDGFIRAELVKQKVPLRVVLSADDAELVITGTATEERNPKWHEGWLTTEQDRTTGNITVVEKATNAMLWAGEAGDRSLWWGSLARGGHGKVASRLVKNLTKAIRAAPRKTSPGWRSATATAFIGQTSTKIPRGVRADRSICLSPTMASRMAPANIGLQQTAAGAIMSAPRLKPRRSAESKTLERRRPAEPDTKTKAVAARLRGRTAGSRRLVPWIREWAGHMIVTVPTPSVAAPVMSSVDEGGSARSLRGLGPYSSR